MNYKNIILFISIIFLNSCNGQSNRYLQIAPAEFSEKINNEKNPQIIDVRTPEEFKDGHLDNAINIDWSNANFQANIAKYDKTRPVYIYCLSGGRSKKAAENFAMLGYQKVYELKGGIMRWNADGFSKSSAKNVGMTASDYDKLISSNKKVLISFYADWCAPCKKMAPFILKMQQTKSDNFVVIRINADEHKTLTTDLKIIELPTLILYENKAIQWRKSGFVSEEDLKKQIQL